MAVMNNNFAAQPGPDTLAYSIISGDHTSAYVNVLVAQTARKETQAIKDFVKAYQSEEVLAKAPQLFKGSAIKGW